ncbi:hypothetical protein [Tessaracoccus antarcticus]|uniref:EfeO-type cupredoxin-like domain-containing protein n=1 Tax=Tessaracoccus antarcticus TaxID=2479848 RepID=A0A3M0G4U9_9ACTN|nr:hypothetical protein [Tessaracoccus antarcticus]RMB60051.1 hypothetical protein EAX62_10105 [Tessaracoccus antarcticus]
MLRPIRALLPLALLAALAGCSTQDSAPPTTIHLDVRAQAPEEPVEERVPLGSEVTLEVSSDVDGLLHVHGFDEELTLTAGETTEKTFKASMSGAFEIETHDPDAVWIKLVVS